MISQFQKGTYIGEVYIFQISKKVFHYEDE